MAVTTAHGEIIRNMIISCLGAGVLLSLFTIVVQNALPYRQLGEVPASLNFFRSIGSTIGVAVMGTILTNAFQSNLMLNMRQALTRLASARHVPLAALQNPQLLPSPDVVAKIQHGFAVFGAQGLALFHQLIEAIRVSLSSAITTVFFLGFIIMLLELFAMLFLREIPLRKSDIAQPAEATPSGSEQQSDQELVHVVN